MIERQATIVNQEGLHARPAARIVRLASSFESDIELGKDGLEVNGKKLEGKWTLAKAIQSMNVGDVARLKIARGDAFLELIARLDAHPPYGR